MAVTINEYDIENDGVTVTELTDTTILEFYGIYANGVSGFPRIVVAEDDDPLKTKYTYKFITRQAGESPPDLDAEPGIMAAPYVVGMNSDEGFSSPWLVFLIGEIITGP